MLNIIDGIDLLQFLERVDFHDILLTDRLYNDLVIGQLLEEILEEHNVRYIAVTDNIDSLKGLDDMVAVRDLFKNTRHLGGVNC